MSRIALSEGFSVIPEGTYVMKVIEAVYKEEFGKMEITLQTAKGQKHTERFSLMKSNGEPNEGAMNAFSYFAKTCMNDFSLTEIDEQDLIGCYIRVSVEHEQVESNRTPGKFNTFARLGDKSPADGFDEAPVAPKTTPTPAPAANKPAGFDLGSLLG